MKEQFAVIAFQCLPDFTFLLYFVLWRKLGLKETLGLNSLPPTLILNTFLCIQCSSGKFFIFVFANVLCYSFSYI